MEAIFKKTVYNGIFKRRQQRNRTTNGTSIFASPPNQVAVNKITYTEERPISSIINESTPIEIVVSGAGNDYIDLRKSRFYVKLQILKVNGDP